MRIKHNACPHCRDMGQKAVLGDRRLYCRRCKRKFTRSVSVWDSIRLPEEVKRRVVRGFVRNGRADQGNRVMRPSVNTRERIRQLCRAACALQVGISVPWQEIPFKLSDAYGRGVELIGLKFTRTDSLNEVAAYSSAEVVAHEQIGKLVTAHIGAFQPRGKQGDRIDLWLRRQQRRVITSDVQLDIVGGSTWDPDPKLVEFAEAVSKFLRRARSVERRYLHLHVGEAWLRYRDGSDIGHLEYTAFRGFLIHRPVKDLYRVIR